MSCSVAYVRVVFYSSWLRNAPDPPSGLWLCPCAVTILFIGKFVTEREREGQATPCTLRGTRVERVYPCTRRHLRCRWAPVTRETRPQPECLLLTSPSSHQKIPCVMHNREPGVNFKGLVNLIISSPLV